MMLTAFYNHTTWEVVLNYKRYIDAISYRPSIPSVVHSMSLLGYGLILSVLEHSDMVGNGPNKMTELCSKTEECFLSGISKLFEKPYNNPTAHTGQGGAYAIQLAVLDIHVPCLHGIALLEAKLWKNSFNVTEKGSGNIRYILVWHLHKVGSMSLKNVEVPLIASYTRGLCVTPSRPQRHLSQRRSTGVRK